MKCIVSTFFRERLDSRAVGDGGRQAPHRLEEQGLPTGGWGLRSRWGWPPAGPTAWAYIKDWKIPAPEVLKVRNSKKGGVK